MIDGDRIKTLNQKAVCDGGTYVLYWMQQSQRADFNHALAYAIARANRLDQGVIVGFGLMDDYPEANQRHYAFMLEGLAETAATLADRNIKLVVNRGAPGEVAVELSRRASLVVCDRGYLRHQRAWRKQVAEEAACAVVQVESDVVVPVEVASDKAEYAARTIRPKLSKHRDRFLMRLPRERVRKSSLPLGVKGDVDIAGWPSVLDALQLDRSVGRVERFAPGSRAARKRLKKFLRNHLRGYAAARNDPADPECSMLSPYLHFGQISPLEIALACLDAPDAEAGDRAAFLEELIVRRELAMNFVYYTPDYDAYDCIPEWARKSLARHRRDRREHTYSLDQLAAAATHDPAWNAAMTEMLKTGYMHNYMRMYWGKKIIEWSATPGAAYTAALTLNNRYFLDGRDANSYVNVAWLFGLHDRPWQEREIFGKVRYMNANGLRRKFNVDTYIEWTRTL